MPHNRKVRGVKPQLVPIMSGNEWHYSYGYPTKNFSCHSNRRSPCDCCCSRFHDGPSSAVFHGHQPESHMKFFPFPQPRSSLMSHSCCRFDLHSRDDQSQHGHQKENSELCEDSRFETRKQESSFCQTGEDKGEHELHKFLDIQSSRSGEVTVNVFPNDGGPTVVIKGHNRENRDDSRSMSRTSWKCISPENTDAQRVVMDMRKGQEHSTVQASPNQSDSAAPSANETKPWRKIPVTFPDEQKNESNVNRYSPDVKAAHAQHGQFSSGKYDGQPDGFKYCDRHAKLLQSANVDSIGALDEGYKQSDTNITQKECDFLKVFDIRGFRPEEVTVKVLEGDVRIVQVDGFHDEREDHDGLIKRGFTKKYFLPGHVSPENLVVTMNENKGYLSIFADGQLPPSMDKERTTRLRDIPVLHNF